MDIWQELASRSRAQARKCDEDAARFRERVSFPLRDSCIPSFLPRNTVDWKDGEPCLPLSMIALHDPVVSVRGQGLLVPIGV